MITKELRELITNKMIHAYNNRETEEVMDSDLTTEEYAEQLKKLPDDNWICELVEMWSILED